MKRKIYNPFTGELKDIHDIKNKVAVTITFQQLNDLINEVETRPKAFEPTYPLIFKGTDSDDSINKAGYNKKGQVIFKVGNKITFVCDEEYWVNTNLDELQEIAFLNESGKYYLLEGTFSGQII